jgi:hypothetical protein
MRIHKRGAELSINVIIIAVLALLILAILIYLTAGKLQSFRTGIESCSGQCVDEASACGDQAAVPMRCDVQAPKETKFCCVDVAGEES